jgi:hypothetical protein
VLLALLLLAGGAILVIFAINPDNTPRCDDVAAALRAGECRDLGSTQETAATIVAWIGSLFAAVGIVAALAFTFTGRGGRRAVGIAVAAIALGVITVAITHG